MTALLLATLVAQIGKPPELDPDPHGPEVAEGAFELKGVDADKGAQLVEALGVELLRAGLRFQSKAEVSEKRDAGAPAPPFTLVGSVVCAADACTLSARMVGKKGRVHSQAKATVPRVDGLFSRVAPMAQVLARELEASLRPPSPKKPPPAKKK